MLKLIGNINVEGLMERRKPIHILRYGTVAEKKHLSEAISSYDYLSINGNTAAYVSNAIAKFIVEKFFSKPQKGYFIDPITYAFQYEIDLLQNESESGEIKLKKSIQRLIEAYGFPANKVENGEPICIADFDNDTKKEFCNNVLKFQYNLVHEHIAKNDLQKYLEYIALEKVNEIPQLRPKFLISPYFYLDTDKDEYRDWLDLNIELLDMAVHESKQTFRGMDVFGQIVLSKSALSNAKAIDIIANKYGEINCAGYTIWIDDLDEHKASKKELEGLMQFLEKLKRKTHKPIYNMYGGYFSILLAHNDIQLLSGVSHGLEYGEYRKVYPVGGGVPVSKYYYFPLHKRLDFTDAFYLLKHANIIDVDKQDWGDTTSYIDKICDCKMCKKVLRGRMINFIEFESREFYEVKRKTSTLRRKKASAETKRNCLYHYLLCKEREFRLLKIELKKLLKDLQKAGNLYSSCEFINSDDYKYIDVWCELLK